MYSCTPPCLNFIYNLSFNLECFLRRCKGRRILILSLLNERHAISIDCKIQSSLIFTTFGQYSMYMLVKK